MNNTKLHQEFMDEVLFQVGKIPSVRIWPRVVGVGRAIDNYAHVISFGLPGESDLDGIIAPGGRKLSIEIKTGSGRLTLEQKRFRDMVVKFGGVHIEARLIEGDKKPFKISVQAVLDELQQYLKE